MKRYTLPLLFLLFVSLLGAQSVTTPDCTQAATFTGVANGPVMQAKTGSGAGCSTIALTWYVTGFSAAKVHLQGSQDNATFADITTTALILEGSNPTSWTTSTVSNRIVIRAYLPYFRVVVDTLTGSGSLFTLMLGYKGTNSTPVAASGGGGTITGGGAAGQVAYWVGPTAIAGDSGFLYDQPSGVASVKHRIFVGDGTLLPFEGDGIQLAVSSDTFGYAYMLGAGDGGTELDQFAVGGTAASPTPTSPGDEIFDTDQVILQADGVTYTAVTRTQTSYQGLVSMVPTGRWNANVSGPTPAGLILDGAAGSQIGCPSPAIHAPGSTLDVINCATGQATTHRVIAGDTQSTTDLQQWVAANGAVLAAISGNGAMRLTVPNNTGHALCQKADNTIGTCSSVVGVGGTCTCN